MKLISTMIAAFAGLVLPVGAGIWLSVKKKGYMKPVLLGVLTFSVFQILTRLPGLYFLEQTHSYLIFSQTRPILYALFLGFTAALFEEGGRYIVMRLLMKNKNRLSDGVAFGVGHGGIEAVIFLGATAVYLLFDLSQPFAPADMLWGSLERVCIMVVHIAWSVMVLKSVAIRKPVWLLAAFALHTAVDSVVVIMAQAGHSILATEVVLLVFALAHLAYILVEYYKHKGVVTQ